MLVVSLGYNLCFFIIRCCLVLGTCYASNRISVRLGPTCCGEKCCFRVGLLIRKWIRRGFGVGLGKIVVDVRLWISSLEALILLMSRWNTYLFTLKYTRRHALASHNEAFSLANFEHQQYQYLLISFDRTF